MISFIVRCPKVIAIKSVFSDSKCKTLFLVLSQKQSFLFYWSVFTSCHICPKLFYDDIWLLFPVDFLTLVGPRDVWIDVSFSIHCIVYNLHLSKLVWSSITFIMRIHIIRYKCPDPNLWWVWHMFYCVGRCKVGGWIDQHGSNPLHYHSCLCSSISNI